MYSGYELSQESRTALLTHFPPTFERLIGHHITEKFGVPADFAEPEQPTTIEVVGRAVCPHRQVEALLVAINGSTERTSDAGKYHITWSLGPNTKPFHSNKIIDRAVLLDTPIPITVTPKVFTQPTANYLKGTL